MEFIVKALRNNVLEDGRTLCGNVCGHQCLNQLNCPIWWLVK